MAIFFHDEKIKSNLKRRRDLKAWIRTVLELEERVPGEINIILTSDKVLKEINVKFLSRNYYTDIITFDYTEGKNVSGDLYISMDRIKENAEKYKENEEIELWRVIVHGVLHLTGYRDTDEVEKKIMRNKENFYLELVPSSK